MSRPNLLSGPDLIQGRENWSDHVARLGRRPAGGAELISVLERSGLTGRGGASFPAGTKWRSVAGQGSGPPVVLVNGAEGEPLSRKDRSLMQARPHLVLDGAFLAAESLRADRVILYLGEELAQANDAMRRALAERPAPERLIAQILAAPPRYVAGEETAAVNFANTGLAAPTAIPPRPFERGVAGRPTLVQNVETLAHAAMIARRGDGWFRSLGSGGSAGTVLLTVGGAVRAPGLIEVPGGTTVAEAVEIAGGPTGDLRAVLLGGYFGSWVEARHSMSLRLDASELRSAGRSLGCGVLWLLPAGSPPLDQVARVMRYLASESASQCGPCFFGLRSLADACERVAGASPHGRDLERLRRWSGEVAGRGACRHPDGAVGFLASAMQVFETEFERASGHASRLERSR